MTQIAVIKYPVKGQRLVTGISHSGTENGPQFTRPTMPHHNNTSGRYLHSFCRLALSHLSIHAFLEHCHRLLNTIGVEGEMEATHQAIQKWPPLAICLSLPALEGDLLERILKL